MGIIFWISQHGRNCVAVWIWMAGRLIFWARKSHALHDVRTIKGPAYKNDQVGGEIVSSDEEDDDEVRNSAPVIGIVRAHDISNNAQHGCGCSNRLLLLVSG